MRRQRPERGQRGRTVAQASPAQESLSTRLLALQQDVGNRAVAASVQRQETATEPDTAAAEPQEGLGPYGVSTPFGSFTVYPEGFVGPLPLSVRSDESWPIRERDFRELEQRLAEVRSGTSQLTVTGTDSFQLQVYLDLGWLMTSGAGQELVQELQDAPHAVTITEKTSGGNATSYASDDSFELPVSPPEPGPGSDVEVRYNPAVLHIKDGTLDWHHRPPAIGLAHELVHAWTGVYGTRARLADEHGVNRRELQATGLGEFSEARLTENRFRREFGLPPRPEY